jgi:hypothetical protein
MWYKWDYFLPMVLQLLLGPGLFFGKVKGKDIPVTGHGGP